MTSNEKNQNRWREFCYDLIEAKANNILEDPYQKLIEQGLRQLSWSKAKGEICSKQQIKIGSHNSLEPDITLKINNVPQFVIEVKKPNNKLTSNQILQLLSYMRQIKVCFGLYIGDRISLFYDDNSEEPINVWNVELDSDDEEGWRFIDFFSRNSFNSERLEIFCKERLKEIISIKGLLSISEKLEGPNGGTYLKEMLEDYLIRIKSFDHSLTKKMLQKFNIIVQLSDKTNDDISDKTIESSANNVDSRYIIEKHNRTARNKSSKDRTKYSLDGVNYYGKNRFVREVIIQFLSQKPNLKYDQLKQIFTDNLQGSYGVIKSLNELSQSKHDLEDLKSRYWMDDDMLLQSADNVRFAVCNQWGRYNFPNIIQLMNKWGWDFIKE